MAGRTTILVAHRASTVRLADRVVVLERGRVVDEGTHADLLRPQRALPVAARRRGRTSGRPRATRRRRRRDHAVGVATGSTATRRPSPPTRVGSPACDGRAGRRELRRRTSPRRRKLLAALERAAAGRRRPARRRRGGRRGAAGAVPRPAVRAPVAAVARRSGCCSSRSTPSSPCSVRSSSATASTTASRAGSTGGAVGDDDPRSRSSTLVDWVATWAGAVVTGRTAERMLLALRIRIFGHLQRLSLDYYDHELDGRVMTRMTTDVEALSQLVQSGLVNAVVGVGDLHRRGGVPRRAVAAARARRRVGAARCWSPARGGTSARPRAPTARHATRSRTSTPTCRRTCPVSASRRRTAGSGATRPRSAARAARTSTPGCGRSGCSRSTSPASACSPTSPPSPCSPPASSLVRDGSTTPAVVIAFVLYLNLFFAPIQQLSQVFDTWQQASASTAKITELLTTPSTHAAAGAPGRRPAGCAASSSCATSTSATGRRAPRRWRGVDLAHRARRDRRARGRDRRRQVDHRQAARPVPRPDERRRARRRHRPARHRPHRVPPAARRRPAGAVPVHRHGARQHRLRPSGRHGRRGRGGGARRGRARVHRRPPARVPHGDVRARALAVRRSAAADRAGAGAARRPRRSCCSTRRPRTSTWTRRRRSARRWRPWRATRTTVLVAHRLPTARTADRIVVLSDGRIVEEGDHDELLAARRSLRGDVGGAPRRARLIVRGTGRRSASRGRARAAPSAA